MPDFHAKVAPTNLTALLAQQAQAERAPTAPRPRRPVNMRHAVACLKGTLVRLLTAAAPPRLINALLDGLRRTLDAVRPGRSCPRLEKRSTLRKFRPGYKRCG